MKFVEINTVVSLCFCLQRAGDEIERLTKERDEKVEIKSGMINRKQETRVISHRNVWILGSNVVWARSHHHSKTAWKSYQ